ncbi:MAG: hypothetical protein FJX77_00205 [Armatimonadetes bacterium]|nr:hypothetical protein [Armatimonadota bacterium]
MSQLVSRSPEITGILYSPAQVGRRAVFLAEARNKKEVRQIRELFEVVGQIADVAPLSQGVVMTYAVQSDGEPALFGKIEWLLKTQFSFSLVERNCSDVTFQLVRSLCKDVDAEVADLPECGICGVADPFPTRITLQHEDAPSVDRSYCARCAARLAEDDPGAAARALLRQDRRRVRVPTSIPVEMPAFTTDVEQAEPAELLLARAS